MKKNFQGGDVKNCTIIPRELFWIQCLLKLGNLILNLSEVKLNQAQIKE